MDVRTAFRWPLWALSGRLRKAAYARLRPWLASRGPYVARCGGIHMEIDFDQREAFRFFVRGNTEPRVKEILEPLLRPGVTFFDAGSHWGYFALLAAKRVGDTGRAVAFEPDPANAECIRKNAALNPGLEVKTEALAVSDGPGSVTFRKTEDTRHGTILDETPIKEDWAERATITVPTVSLDDYIDESGIDRVDVMKMDIEGAEVQAIEGMASGLRAGRYGDIVIEWHGSHHGELGTRPVEALKLLASSGHDLFVLKRRGRLEPVSPESVPADRIHLFCRAPQR